MLEEELGPLQLHTYAAAGGPVGLKAGGWPGQTDALPLGNRVLRRICHYHGKRVYMAVLGIPGPHDKLFSGECPAY